MIPVDEIFGPTIQGEGKYMGNISVFVRFSRCNMNCSGFVVPYGDGKFGCDSFHAVDKMFQKSWQNFDNSYELIDHIEKLSLYDDVVFTGGEPLLYWDTDIFQQTLKYLHEKKRKVTIETNGTIDIDIQKLYQKDIVFSIGLKLSNSGESKQTRFNQKAIDIITKKANISYFKFVIDEKNLTSLEDEILSITKIFDKTEVFLMPLGDSAKKIEQNSHSTIDLVLKHKFKYSDRLHIRLWDNERKR